MTDRGCHIRIRLLAAAATLVALVPPPAAYAATFSSSTPITINDDSISPTAATPYPSTIAVSGLSGGVAKVTVTLTNFSHTAPDDVDVLLVGPAGQTALLLSDVGGGNPGISNVTLTLDDAAPGLLPDGSGFASGTYKPTNVDTSDSFPPPAPAGPYPAALSGFNGTNPNGTWRLFVVDDSPGDAGSIAGGWSLSITLGNVTLSDIPDQATAEDTPTTVSFTVTDEDTPPGGLAFSATSSNTTLVPNANLAFGGTGASRTLTIAPAANQVGTTTIAVTVGDGTSTATDTFVLTVNPVDDSPTISDIPDQITAEDTPTAAIAFAVGDAETPAGSLALSATSSNPDLVPVGNIAFGGAGAARTLTVTPLPDRSGTATIVVTVGDGALTASDSFVLTVTPTNDPPTISDIPDQLTSRGRPVGPIGFRVADPEGIDGLTLSATSSNPALVPSGTVTFGGAGANRTVTVAPAAGRTGTATITVTVSDGALTASDTFRLTVTLNPPVDVQVRAVAGPAAARLGQTFVYTLAVTNHGPSVATGVSLTDTLTGATIHRVVATRGTCGGVRPSATAGPLRAVTCALGALGPGASATVRVVAGLPDAAIVTNSAVVTTTSSDIQPANNRVVQRTRVRPPSRR